MSDYAQISRASRMTEPEGVSIAICCHNSRERLPAVLESLKGQRVPSPIQWEVLVVDNASTDDTERVALLGWGNNGPARLRAVREPRAGLVNARLCALENARYSVISFIDDDNLVASNWVEGVFNIFKKNLEVGACGGRNVAKTISQVPDWFDRFSRSYAVGAQRIGSGDASPSPGALFGAGLSVRKAAWNEVVSKGFQFRLTGRLGKKLLCGEDYELCLALRLAGWKLWYDDSLVLEHVLSPHRLTWKHLREMIRSAGHADVILECYQAQLQGRQLRPWYRIVMNSLRRIVEHPVSALICVTGFGEGNATVLQNERYIGRIRGATFYRRNHRDIWFQVGPLKR
jgi:glycosyltransferase involved in cell wall biosynthesis